MFSFPMWMYFIFFSSFIALNRISTNKLHRSGEIRQTSFVSWEKTLGFFLSFIFYMSLFCLPLRCFSLSLILKQFDYEMWYSFLHLSCAWNFVLFCFLALLAVFIKFRSFPGIIFCFPSFLLWWFQL